MLNSQIVFIECYCNCKRLHLLKQSWLSLCHALTKEIGHTGLPKNMSDLVYHYAHKYADSIRWYWLTVADLQAYYKSIPARQVKALLLNKSCQHINKRDEILSLINYLQRSEVNPEDIRLIFWIKKEK